MIQKMIEGIAAELSARFPECEIYEETPKQGLIEPCFLISLITPIREKLRGVYYEYYGSFDVAYFPKSKEAPREEICSVIDDIDDALESIAIEVESGEVGAWNTGSDGGSIVDDVYHITAKYRIQILRGDVDGDGDDIERITDTKTVLKGKDAGEVEIMERLEVNNG